MRGSRRLPAVAPHPGEDGGPRVCIDVPGLNRAASQERLAFARGALRGSTSQLRSHAFRPAERGRRSSAPTEEHSGGSGGQASCGPGGDGDGPRRPTCAPGASRGSWARGIVRVGFFIARRPLLQHHSIFNGTR